MKWSESRVVHCTIPADFERQSALLLNAARLGIELPQSTLLSIIAEVVHRLPVFVLVRDEQQRAEMVTQLSDWGLASHNVYYLRSEAQSAWIRDFGPVFRRQLDGRLMLLDADYYMGADLPYEQRVPAEMAELLRFPVQRVPLTVEGGNILSNGRGLCLTTGTFIERNARRGLAVQELGRIFRECYGFDQIATLMPLVSEATGHVDMFAAFTSPDTVVVGQYDPRIDPVNADRLDFNANALSNFQTPLGRLRVVRIPMPPNRSGLWRSYTNVVFANGILLVPDYGLVDPHGHQRALETYRMLLPDWDIRSVDARRLAFHEGALRCLTSGIPWDDVFARFITDETPFDATHKLPADREAELLIA